MLLENSHASPAESVSGRDIQAVQCTHAHSAFSVGGIPRIVVMIKWKNEWPIRKRHTLCTCGHDTKCCMHWEKFTDCWQS